jgi:NarL family two-component system response regulator LiaR
MAEKIRVLIAEDHAVVRMGLRALISSEPAFELAGEAADGAEAVRKALELKPDVIVMDLLMPVKDGIEAIGEIRRAIPDARILVLTSYNSSDKVVPAVRAGAVGYILKDAHPQEIVAAIKYLHSGQVYFHQSIARLLFRDPQVLAEQEPVAEELTDREIEILRLIAQGLSNEEIAERLVITRSTVGVHIGRILGKLGLSNRTQAALYALRTGIASLNPQ